MNNEELGNADNNTFRSFDSHRNGFTLIEVVIVLIIMALAASLIGLAITRSSGSTLRTLTREMSSTLRYARNHAVSEKKQYCFVINVDDGMYRLYGDKLNEDEEPVPEISKPVPGNIQVTMETMYDDNSYLIEFYPFGNTSGGTIELQSESGKTYSIAVNRLSGKVEVAEAE
jgi:general secretion pathway protein H